MGSDNLPDIDAEVMGTVWDLLRESDFAAAADLVQRETGADRAKAMAKVRQVHEAMLVYDELPEARGITGIPELAEREIRREVRRGNEIVAIMRLREETSMGLLEARRLVEAIRKGKA